MRGRTAALIAAATVTTGAVATAAMAAAPAGPPPPPKATNGHAVQVVATGVTTPTSFAFGGGSVFEGDGGSETANPPNGGVFVLKNGTATLIPGSPVFVAGLAWHQGALYVSGGVLTAKGPSWQLQKWTGWNGTTFSSQKAIYTAPKKFQGFNGIGFGANGRLYVGVDVGLLNGNDHGPSTISPHVYQILSFKPNGKDLQVFAKGIRQPWQMAFPKGSSSPFVSDLGQDKGAKNPPDFVLRVKKGDNYGFPSCNQTSASKCTGFTKPFQQFSPHTDIMGQVIMGNSNKLYMTSFLGPNGKGGQVLWMPQSGGTAKTLVKGVAGPVVGLGGNDGWLYFGLVGNKTGQGVVYRVKP